MLESLGFKQLTQEKEPQRKLRNKGENQRKKQTNHNIRITIIYILLLLDPELGEEDAYCIGVVIYTPRSI